MPKGIRFLRGQQSLLLTLGAYVLLAVSIAPLYLYRLNNDGTAYLSIAKQYAAGDWSGAVSTYWGPLFSWLIAACLHVGIDDLIAAKAVSLCAGFLLVIVLSSYRSFLRIRDDVWLVTIVSSALLAIFFALDLITPDLILALLVVAYMRLASDRSLFRRWWFPVLCGILGGVGYLTKAAMLPLFVLHFTGINAFEWFALSSDRKNIAVRWIVGLVIAFLVASPWIAAISSQYGSFTIGRNASFVHATLTPLGTVPMYSQGLLEPSEGKFSAWDDPTRIPVEDWSALDSAANAVKQLKIVFLNAEYFMRLALGQSLLLWAILCAGILFCWRLGQQEDKRFFAISFTGLWILTLGMYLPFVIEYRYFWGSVFLALPLGAMVLSDAFASLVRPRLAQMMTLALFSLSFLAVPFWNAVIQYRDGENFFAQMKTIEKTVDLHGQSLASDNWKFGLQAGYYLGARYYGRPLNWTDATTLERELVANNIENYLVFGSVPKGLTTYTKAVALSNSVKATVLRKR